jgi:Flp pilus assembly protein TadG
MLAVLFIALLALAGLVVDGGAKLDADQKATAVAQEAARAGAGMVNVPRAYAGGPFTVSPAQAIVAARRFLTAAGYPGSQVRQAGPDSIRVTVTIQQPTVMLSLIGLRSFAVQGTATASLVTGVTGPGQ